MSAAPAGGWPGICGGQDGGSSSPRPVSRVGQLALGATVPMARVPSARLLRQCATSAATAGKLQVSAYDPFWRPASGSLCSRLPCKYRNSGDLLGTQRVPVDSRWPFGVAAPGDAVWCHYEVYAEVVVCLGQVLGEQLEFVDSCGDGGLFGDQSGLGEQCDLEVGVGGSFAEPGAVVVDRHAPDYHKVDMRLASLGAAM